MAANEELLRRAGAFTPAMARARGSGAVSLNDTLSFHVDAEGTCAAKDQVRAVVRRIGSHAVWLDDIENPSGTFTDSQLAELDAFYESDAKPVHDKYFGQTSDVDGNGRVLILMTKEVNRRDRQVGSSNPGWINLADLLPTDRCSTSNRAEIYYGRVPDPGGVFGDAWTTQEALELYPRLLTLSITLLIQANARMFGGADFAQWEILGGAVLSQQLVGNRLLGHGSGRNLGYGAFRQGVRWYVWVSGLASFFGWDPNSSRIPNAPEACSWMGRHGPCSNANIAVVYGVPSMVLRYAMDRFGGEYPTGEQGLMRHLTRSPRRGLASLADVSGWPAEKVLADFYISLWIDLNGGDADGMATWDLEDIWSRLPAVAQLRPYVTVSTEFRRRWDIRAGSTSYLHWKPRDSRGPTSLRVTSPSGAPIPGHISVWALRIR